MAGKIPLARLHINALIDNPKTPNDSDISIRNLLPQLENHIYTHKASN